MGWSFKKKIKEPKIEEKMFNIILSDFELIVLDSDIDFEQIEI